MIHQQGAIFDLDGTLLDSLHVWQSIDMAFLAKRGLTVPENYSQEISALSFRETAEYTIARFSLNERPEDVMHEWNQMAIEAYAHTVPLKPGAKDYLLYLKSQGVRLGVCTALSQKLYLPCLQNNKIYTLFDALVSTDDVHRGKHQPDAWLVCAARLGLPPQHCTAYEDVLLAMQGAKAAHMRVCAVYDQNTQQNRSAIEQVADCIIENFTTLL